MTNAERWTKAAGIERAMERELLHHVNTCDKCITVAGGIALVATSCGVGCVIDQASGVAIRAAKLAERAYYAEVGDSEQEVN